MIGMRASYYITFRISEVDPSHLIVTIYCKPTSHMLSFQLGQYFTAGLNRSSQMLPFWTFVTVLDRFTFTDNSLSSPKSLLCAGLAL